LAAESHKSFRSRRESSCKTPGLNRLRYSKNGTPPSLGDIIGTAPEQLSSEA
jgi:hypothetical protein